MMTAESLAMAQEMASILLGMAAVPLLALYLDRMRMLRWRQHLWPVVGMHLSLALWLGAVVFDGLSGGHVEAYHALGLAGVALWLGVSRSTWRDGPPEHTQSAPGALADEPHHHHANGAAP